MEIDFGGTRAYCFGYGGQIYLGEITGAETDRRFAEELAEALAGISHPESGEPAFEVRRKEELYRGFYLDKAPELVLLPRDERIHVDFSASAGAIRSSVTSGSSPAGRPTSLASTRSPASWPPPDPGIARVGFPQGCEITQCRQRCSPCTASRRTLDAPAIEAILARAMPARRPVGAVSHAPSSATGYTQEEEARIVERLRDLGYE